MNEIKILDKGHVKLLEHFGDDKTVVESARVSYDPDSTKTVSDDQQLIRYLMRHDHHTPFEGVVFRFHIKMPLFVKNQLVRYRIGASINEVSARYSIIKDEYHVPNCLRKPSKSNKQGSTGRLKEDEKIINDMEDLESECFKTYNKYLKNGVCREQARIVLPQGSYTEWIYTVNLRSLMHIIHQRLDSHAQYEIQVYANAFKDLISPLVPMTMKAFEDYVLNARKFSANEMELILETLDTTKLIELLKINPEFNSLEQRELLNKLNLKIKDLQ